MLNMSSGDVSFSSDDVVEKVEADGANVYTQRLLRELAGLRDSARQRMMSPQVASEESKRLNAEVEFWNLGIDLLEELWPLIHNQGGM